MTGSRPSGVAEGDAWPILAAVMEHDEGGDHITFAVSDIAPEEYLGPVVLGVDNLTASTGEVVAVVARFDLGGCTVCSTTGGTSTEHPDARVDFSDGAVTITANTGVRMPGPGDHPVAFCLVDGVPFQLDVPVVMMPARPPAG
ncbi:hypothetical protein SCB71_12460 [Herbiconiux sp. KACC 21604]|uniref:hypothetical protein n=1 Tax=unclassified Herbiconiux TaxID=2618217 RepID=UPI0014917F74|nr:hypothetical protein [Herbiconiux sp. SALV-R1]QJU53996.1 hypothetical protein HL652_10410 [Herbiconiux sp. SALV-R1]WPO85025.1 hypothetical protein SCB71_12460 [Herbiconiux sp. KACC 21604]